LASRSIESRSIADQRGQIASVSLDLISAQDAVTHADSPSRAGKVYRALVIGSGGHALIIKRFLRQLRAAVEKRD
jgi:hypothetical protein